MALSQSIPPGEQAVRTDQRVRMHGMSWSSYEALLDARGESPVPRIAYLEGELELMTRRASTK